MKELVLLLAAEIDVQVAFESYEDYQEGRGVTFLQHLETAFEPLRRLSPVARPAFSLHRFAEWLRPVSYRSHRSHLSYR